MAKRRKRSRKKSTKRAKLAWHAISTKRGFVVKKARKPRRGYGPFRDKREACEVGKYQGGGVKPQGC
jgi:hypothetical protein